MVHTKNGTFSDVLRAESQGYKRLFVSVAVHGDTTIFSENSTLSDAVSDRDFLREKYGDADIVVTWRE